MGRRDSEGSKKKPWRIEAGDWERLYEALLKAKEKNIVLDVRLQREKSVIEMARKHRDRTLFNDIFEQKQLAYKYKCQKQKAEKTNKRAVEAAKADRRKMISKMSLPSITIRKQSVVVNKPPRQTLTKTFTLPLVKSDVRPTARTYPEETIQHTERSVLHPMKPPVDDLHKNNTETNLRRSCTFPNLYTLFDKSGNTITGNPLSAAHWVGDPEAINSVRRKRLDPDEMTDHSKPCGEARKLLIELAAPQACSRQYTTRSETNLPEIGSYHLRPGPGSHQNLLSITGLLQ